MKRLMVAMLVLSAGATWACSCARVRSFFPSSGSTGVPTNVVVQLFGSFLAVPTSASLIAGADSIALTIDSRGANWVSLTPERALLPGTDYQLTFGPSQEEGITFKTGAGPDTTPPAATVLHKVTGSGGAGPCGAGQAFELSLAASSDDTGPVVFVAFTGTDGDHLGTRPQAMLEQFGFLTDSLCSQNFPLQKTPDLAVAISAMDLAGNLSPPTPARQLKTAGCAAAPGDLLGLLAIGLLYRRRRGLTSAARPCSRSAAAPAPTPST